MRLHHTHADRIHGELTIELRDGRQGKLTVDLNVADDCAACWSKEALRTVCPHGYVEGTTRDLKQVLPDTMVYTLRLPIRHQADPQWTLTLPVDPTHD